MDFLMQNQFQFFKNYNFQFLEEEEEIEWIPNKDAFVFSMVELSAVVPTASHVSSRVRKARSKSGRKKRKSLEWAPPEKPEPEPGNAAGRECGHCKAEETPQWRAGPFGPKTLCNACGIRYKSGRLVPEYRPARSPTFSSELHSNSHRKIVEMMRMKQIESGFVFKHK